MDAELEKLKRLFDYTKFHIGPSEGDQIFRRSHTVEQK